MASTTSSRPCRPAPPTCGAARRPPGDEGWIVCADLLADPDRLRREIDATAAGRGTADPQVAASLYAQAYAFRVPSVAVAAYALGLPVPSDGTGRHRGPHRPPPPGRAGDPRPDVPADGGGRGRPHGGRRAPGAVRRRRPGHDEDRRAAAVGQRGGVDRAPSSGPSKASGRRAIPRSRARAQELFAAAPCLDGLGDFTCVEVPGALGWYWDRTSCCLWYQTTSGAYCDDCSLHDPAELEARRRADLIGSTAP